MYNCYYTYQEIVFFLNTRLFDNNETQHYRIQVNITIFNTVKFNTVYTNDLQVLSVLCHAIDY